MVNTIWNRGIAKKHDPEGCSSSHLRPRYEATKMSKHTLHPSKLPVLTNIYPTLPHGLKKLRPDVYLHLSRRETWKLWIGYAQTPVKNAVTFSSHLKLNHMNIFYEFFDLHIETRFGFQSWDFDQPWHWTPGKSKGGENGSFHVSLRTRHSGKRFAAWSH